MKCKVLIAGQEGMVGSSIYNILKTNKKYKILECKRNDLDFTSQNSVDKWFKKKNLKLLLMQLDELEEF